MLNDDYTVRSIITKIKKLSRYQVFFPDCEIYYNIYLITVRTGTCNDGSEKMRIVETIER